MVAVSTPKTASGRALPERDGTLLWIDASGAGLRRESNKGNYVLPDYGFFIRTHTGSGPDVVDDVGLILSCQGTGTGQANAPLIQIFGDITPVMFAIPKKPLQMHGFPDGSRLDAR